jgi:hypothetical protein
MSLLLHYVEIVLCIAIAIVLALLPFASHGAEQLHHPAAGESDPYAGYLRADGMTSCCGGEDCAPTAWNDDRGEVFLPPLGWIEPRGWVNSNGTRPALYFSFDGHAHICVSGDGLVCVFVPGAAAALGE